MARPTPYKRLENSATSLRNYIFVNFQQITSNLAILLFKGALCSAVDGFFLTGPCQKLKIPWKGLFA